MERSREAEDEREREQPEQCRSQPQHAAAVEGAQADPARALTFANEDAGDQVAREHEERGHTDIRAVPPDRPLEVREHDEPDRDGTQPVEVRAIRDLPGLRLRAGRDQASRTSRTRRVVRRTRPCMATQYQWR